MSKKRKQAKKKVPSSHPISILPAEKTKPLNPDLLIWLAAAAIFLISLVIRSYAFFMPVVGDESVYGILGRKAMMGAALYKDIYEMKPPLLFYSYGLSTSIFGWGTTGLRLTGLLLVLFNSFMVYSIARRFTSVAFSALVGAICFFFLNNLYAYATETAAEHFYMSLVLSGYYLLIHPKPKSASLNLFIAGFLIAGAAMIKQTAALFGMGALLLVVWYSFVKNPNYPRKKLPKTILFLGLGAIAMIALNLLPLVLYGTLTEAKYWLFTVPSQYATEISSASRWVYMEALGGRILQYQTTTIIFALLGLASLAVNYKEKYFPFLLILSTISILVLFPGFRFYSQYWIPLMTVLALSLISLKDAITKLKWKAGVVLALVALAAVLVDTIKHKDEYFEQGYFKNAEKAYSGNYPYVHIKMIEYMKERMAPGQSFLMLGSHPFTYYAMDQFPASNHIYPRAIYRDTPENLIYQESAIEEMKNGNHDYILFSITGLAWKGREPSIDNWYLNAFSYVNNNYEPILAFNLDEMKYYYNQADDLIDLYRPNQLVALKKR